MTEDRSTQKIDTATERWTLAATILGSAMAFIDGSVVNVALPAIQNDLHATVADMQWTVNAYTLFLGALILVGGSAGDHFGRRRIFILGIVLFTATSVWCGLAPDITQLIIARGAQGIGGAMMVPASLAIISATFPRDKRGRAIGTWAGFGALTTALGPVLGGWLVDTFSWRPIFFINLPLALITIIIVLRYVRESYDHDVRGALDWEGALLATLGLGGIIYGLIEASERSWNDPYVIIALVAGSILLALFMVVESRRSEPMMPLDLFRSRTFAGANLLTLLVYFALIGALFFLPFNLIQVHGYTATEAGAAFLPFTLLMGGLSRWSGGLIDRYGPRTPLIVGPVIVAAGYLLFMLPGVGGSYWTTFFPAILVLGFGMSVTVAPLTTAVLGAVSEEHAGVASGINNAVSRVSGTLAVAILGIVALGVFNTQLDQQFDALHIPAEVRTAMAGQRDRLAAAKPPEDADATTQHRIRQATGSAFVYSFRTLMLIAAIMALGGSAAAWLMIEPDAEGPPSDSDT